MRLVFDSNLANEKRMPCSYPQEGEWTRVPASLVKSFRLEAMVESGGWETVMREDENYQRLVEVPLHLQARGLRLVVEQTWGAGKVRVFAFEPLSELVAKIPLFPEGLPFSEVRANIPTEDLAAPGS